MDFTGNYIKKGSSTVGDFRLDFNVNYDSDNKSLGFEGQIFKDKTYLGNFSYSKSANRICINFINTEVLDASSRQNIYTEIESTIKSLNE